MGEVKRREEIDEQFKWKMEDVYAAEDLFEKEKEQAKEKMQRIAKYQGTLCRDFETFRDCMILMRDARWLVERVYFYANQRYHEDLGVGRYQGMAQEAGNLINEYGTKVSFIEPEILAADNAKIEEYLSDASMKEFVPYISDLMRQKEHVLGKSEEEILAAAGKIASTADDIFQIMNNADFKFEDVVNEQGEKFPLTHGRYSMYLESQDRTLRKSAFENVYKLYDAYANTLSTIYASSVKKDQFYASVRKYDSCRAMFLADANIPESVYDNLIEVVHENLPILHRYVELRKRALHLDEVHLYDMYTPMVDEVEFHIPYEEAKKMVVEGLAPMGQEYLEILQEGMENGWIDVYENEGKRSGAYSWSVYGTHPYVLLNYQDNLDSVFTLAHEMGHAMHSYYSNQTQPYMTADYKIFVAEVASTCNESLLIQHLIDKCENQKEKAYLLNHFLEQFRTTLFRQTMFAEFEKKTHELVDTGKPLNKDILCEIYYDLNKQYFGDNVVVDSQIAMEWARIPHFYSAFYVYQYATGFSAAIALSKRILDMGEEAMNDYKKFLSGGSSSYPIELLKAAGVDMSEKKPVEDAIKLFEKLLLEFETYL